MNREITVTMYLHAHPLALRYYTFSIANESAEFGNIHDPNIHDPNIHDPNIHDPNIHDPNIRNPNIHDPNIHDPNIHDPNIHDPNIHDPNIHDPNIHDPNIHDPNIHDPNIYDPNIHDPNIHNQYMATLLSYTFHLINPQGCQPLKQPSPVSMLPLAKGLKLTQLGCPYSLYWITGLTFDLCRSQYTDTKQQQ